MKKFILLLLLIATPCYAKNPISAKCGEFKGLRIEVNGNKVTETTDKISKKQTFIFSNEDNKIFSDLGDSYILLNSKNLVGFAVYPQSYILITFYPEKEKAIISKHSDFINLSDNISAFTLIADCTFTY